MDGLRAQARQRFLQEQKFKEENAALYGVDIPLITIARFKTETTFSDVKVPWIQSKRFLDRVNQPIEDSNKQSPTATLKLVKFDREIDGTLLINQQLFMEVFQDFGFDAYWLHMLLCSVYGFFQLRDEGRSWCNYYLNTVSYTLLWVHKPCEKSTRVIIIPREADGVDDRDSIFSNFLQSMYYHRSLIDDCNFCSFLSTIQLVQWIEKSVSENLGLIRSTEIRTEHGTWLDQRKAIFPPGTDELVEKSKEMGLSLAALANVVRHVSLAETIFCNLPSREQPSHDHRFTFTNTAVAPVSSADQIANAVGLLRGQVESSKLQANYLQERARTQHSVIFNLLTRHDAESSKNIAQAAKHDSYSMKTIAIMTMVFLPPTFFATLFAMPLLQWQDSTVVKPNFWVYWVFAGPSTVLVLLVWYFTSKEEEPVVGDGSDGGGVQGGGVEVEVEVGSLRKFGEVEVPFTRKDGIRSRFKWR
ncbi:hypothetical protein F5Y00DRAFT_271908 [Daldinia vernicosa]|uniref:uncharacterized protein n=1 Tax=Daldinia vernicosa TaxID=114800 RepID=UPI0020083EFA|nr:uncharacterized protein F5Y00DRAFT_271908 [Daldinia vernicosa]KAI0846618.1 hypothetical protein F5Y00DRAFT_271908 [Daldinia vernicosa]